MPAKKVRRRLVQLLGRMRRAAATTGEPSVRAGLKQFLKVTRSYWPGLFRCYDAADLPRTNNDLEHTFGSHRYHERRSSGRRRASPGLVVMGSARLVSGLATRLRPERGCSCRRAMWRVGESCERSWRDAVKVGASNGDFAMTGRLSREVGATVSPVNFALFFFKRCRTSDLFLLCGLLLLEHHRPVMLASTVASSKSCISSRWSRRARVS